MHEQTPAPPAEHPGPPGGPPGPPPAAARGALIGQAALVLVGAYVVYTSLGLTLWGHLGPGPGFLPFVLGVSLLLLAVSWFIQERARAARAATAVPASAAPDSATPTQGATDPGTPPAGETAKTAETTQTPGTAETAETFKAAETTDTPAAGTGAGSSGRGHVIAIMVSLVVLGSLIDLLGFQLTMFAFLLFHLLRTRDVRWWVALIIALVGSVGTFVLFGAGLGVQLPAASVPFLANLGL